jgi:hypothetical protein
MLYANVSTLVQPSKIFYAKMSHCYFLKELNTLYHPLFLLLVACF